VIFFGGEMFFKILVIFGRKTRDSLFFCKKSSHLQNKKLKRKEEKKIKFVTMPKIMIQSPF
jgi:hypothetical protein